MAHQAENTREMTRDPASGCKVFAEISPCISFSLLQSGMPLIHSIEIENLKSSRLEQARLQITASPPFFTYMESPLPPLAQGETFRLESIPLLHDPRFFAELEKNEIAKIHVRVLSGEEEVEKASFPVELLALDRWSGGNVFPESIASFVLPEHPSVKEVLKEALHRMRMMNPEISFKGSSSEKKEILEQVSLVWHVLLDKKLSIAPLSENFEEAGAAILNPAALLEAGRGTPLDISLLMASCLEGCGLNPILVFMKDHVFCGCWLSSAHLPTVITDDVTFLRKRLDLEEIIVFETALLTESRELALLEEASRRAKENVRKNRSENFHFLVDIRQARMQGIPPLDIEAGFDVPAIKKAHFLKGPEEPKKISNFFTPAKMQKAEAAEQTRLERWQRKLLDLSLRNSLLNYRMEKSRRFVEILTPDPAKLEDRLAQGQSFRLLSGPDIIREDPRHSSISAGAIPEELLENLVLENSMKSLSATRSHSMLWGANNQKPGSLVTPLEGKELDLRLLTLYRASRLALEEGGANTLFLAFGFLTWKPGGRTKPCKAPLVLVPARLERRSVKGGFTLSFSDDEPRFNLTLLELLKRDYEITELDVFSKELPVDAHGLDIEGIWKGVQRAVRDMPGWEVSATTGLGLFSFAKYLMWQDLTENISRLRDNELVNHLLSENLPFAIESPFPEPRDLDEKLPSSDVFCPLLADSSQLSAVTSAAMDKDFVLIGPPGTGKSQTIANIIAQCIANGKTVLFVAEKATALNVVYRRLKEVGLEDFCLELHSNKANKAEVIARLVKNVRSREKTETDRENVAFRMDRTRKNLNAYVRELHTVYPNGLTPFIAMGTVAAHPDIPEVHLSWPSLSHHDRKDYAALFDLAEKMKPQVLLARKLEKTSLALIRKKEWVPFWEKDFIEALQKFYQGAEKRKNETERLSSITSLPFSDESGKELSAQFELVEALPRARNRGWAFLLKPGAGKILNELKDAEKLLHEYDAKWQTVSTPYRPEILNADIPALQAWWSLGCISSWPKSFFTKRRTKKEMRKFCRFTARPDYEKDLAILSDLSLLKSALEDFTGLGEATAEIFCGLDTKRWELREVLAFGETLHKALDLLSDTPEKRGEFLGALEKFLLWESLPPSHEEALLSWKNSVLDFQELAEATRALMEGEKKLSMMAASEAMALSADILSRKEYFHSWCLWLKNVSDAENLGLAPITEALLSGKLEPENLKTSLETNYSRWWVMQLMEENMLLRSFSSLEHERLIKDFKELDEDMRLTSIPSIRERLRMDGLLATIYSAEWHVLQRESAKKKRHMPIRKLISGMPSLLPRLTPCLLMSPLSIAQYLPPGEMLFDLVIFDEASQIPAWDAVGAMARGKRVVVVGDPKQLPPTNFFRKTDEADDDDEENEDLESILDECLGSGVPSLRLRWHYRSRHESLIAFSNRRYYENELVTFPSPDTEEKAVRFIYAGGTYERGGSRTNPVEAKALVKDLVKRLLSPGPEDLGKSLGVVTFNSQQQALIEDLLDAEREKNPNLEVFFDPDGDEPVLVKNLENIQGDERDIMYFSIGFGPDSAGKITMNFGALNKDGGERRLNVAVTRARHAIRVYSSLTPDEIQTERTGSKGVHDLKLFLEYAKKGKGFSRYAGEEATTASSFENTLASALREKGWQVKTGIGESLFRVDLGIIDPGNPERYLAGLTCDGATYAAAATARDRDRLREEVLRGLGWEIFRAWSVDWWMHPERTLEKLDKELSDFLSAGGKKGENRSLSMGLAEKEKKSVERKEIEKEESTGKEKIRLDPVEEERFRAIIRMVVAEEAPIHENVLTKHVANHLGLSRPGSRVRSMVAVLAPEMYEHSREDVGIFYWNEGPQESLEFRERSQARKIEEIALPELKALARSIQARKNEDAVLLMARQLGIKRLGAADRKRLEKAWKKKKVGSEKIVGS